MSDAFYVPDDGRFISTDWTRGPWDPDYQHAGPPAALLARTIERLPGADDFRVARITVEILRSVPVAPLAASARLLRPGRRVQLAEAALSDEAGEVAIARAWRMRRGDTASEQSPPEPPRFRGPAEAPPLETLDPWNGPSYFAAVEWRLAAGDFLRPGPATMWMRMRGQLVDGEEPSPLTRILVAADSGNGISQELSMATHLFINTELSVHVFREPRGEWICLDARTRIGPEGVGLAASALYDTDTRIGAAHQALLVRAR